MMTDKKTPKPRWRKRFLALLALNVIIIIGLAVLLFWPVKETPLNYESAPKSLESTEFVVQTTKENLNELINAYIEKLTDGTNHNYSVTLGEDVHLQGDLPIFSTTVPLSVHLVPFVQDDGNIVLEQKSISVGLLRLPNKKIMEYMEQYLPMPDWVTIRPQEENMHVAITNMDIKSNFKVKIESFDLETNDIAFKINIPYKTLGIDAQSEKVVNLINKNK